MLDPLRNETLHQISHIDSNERLSQSQAIVQENGSNNMYKQWICSSIQQGSINCYLENNITISMIPIARGAYGVVHKGIIKDSGKTVAMKTLFPEECNCEEKLYKKFVKEVVVD